MVPCFLHLLTWVLTVVHMRPMFLAQLHLLLRCMQRSVNVFFSYPGGLCLMLKSIYWAKKISVTKESIVPQYCYSKKKLGPK